MYCIVATISSNFWLSYIHLLQISTREGTKVGRTVGGVTSIEGQLLNSRAPDIALTPSAIVSDPMPNESHPVIFNHIIPAH